ncbi:MAG: DoxX family protein [Acidobacteria bacterium]|nr:DoxX family protein [Acidobacteriota bacterium]
MKYTDIIRELPLLFAAMFTAILFLQSGLDKVFDRKGNLEWLTGHFSKTFVAGMVPVMLAQITVLELLTGIAAAAGIIYFFAAGSTIVIFIASILGALTLSALFVGQRIAKDYPGAAVLVPYFILELIAMYLSMPKGI